MSAAKEDYGASGQPSLYRLKRRHDDRVYYAYLGDWLVLDNGHLSIVDNDTFMAQHEGIQRLMRVLVACEFSGIVRDAFIERGHEAISCDLLPRSDLGRTFKATCGRCCVSRGTW